MWKISIGMVALIVGLGYLALMVTGRVIGLITKIIHSLTECSVQIVSASEQIAVSSQGLAQGSSEQASSMEETLLLQ